VVSDVNLGANGRHLMSAELIKKQTTIGWSVKRFVVTAFE
jgi:hypothetical protein